MGARPHADKTGGDATHPLGLAVYPAGRGQAPSQVNPSIAFASLSLNRDRPQTPKSLARQAGDRPRGDKRQPSAKGGQRAQSDRISGLTGLAWPTGQPWHLETRLGLPVPFGADALG